MRGRHLAAAGLLAAALPLALASPLRAQARRRPAPPSAAPPSPPLPPPAASPPAAPAPQPSGAAGSVYGTCVEHVSAGAQRPVLRETFPATGLGGYVLWLEVEVEHGRGETVLPDGFTFSAQGGAAEALSRAGFTLPAPESGQAPAVEPAPPGPNPGPRATSRVRLPLVALPKEPGRVTLTLPPLPVAVARASGEVTTMCTAPHAVALDEPTASTPEARPKPNPPPRRQREHWQAAETAASGLLAVLVGLVAGFLLYRWWSRRPRPVPPPPPPRPVWEVAIEDLALLRTGPLFTEGRYAELVARVSAVLRRYLGERYGFEGLEATSKEVRRALRRVFPPLPVLAEIDKILDETDLVKFARVEPGEAESAALCELADRVVRATIPVAVAAADLVPSPRPSAGGVP